MRHDELRSHHLELQLVLIYLGYEVYKRKTLLTSVTPSSVLQWVVQLSDKGLEAVSVTPDTTKVQFQKCNIRQHSHCIKELTLKKKTHTQIILIVQGALSFFTIQIATSLPSNKWAETDCIIQLAICKDQITKTTLFEISPHSGKCSYKMVNKYLRITSIAK